MKISRHRHSVSFVCYLAVSAGRSISNTPRLLKRLTRLDLGIAALYTNRC